MTPNKNKYTIPNNDANYITDEALKLIGNIEFKSVDKDNMEFECKLTCFQKEALEAMFYYTVGMY